MKTLVQSNSIEPADPRQQNRPLLPTWFYFAADILLLAFTVGITLDATRPFDLGTVIFCAISVGVGGLLAIGGLLQSTDRDGF